MTAADWVRVRSAPRAVRWAMTQMPGTAEIENNAGGESAKTEGRLRSYFCFHKQDAKTGRNGCIGTFKKKSHGQQNRNTVVDLGKK